MKYRPHNNKKRTNGRNFQMIPTLQVVAFVVMPRFGTKTHESTPDMRQLIEVAPIDNKSLREQSDFFANNDLSASKKAKLWKQCRKQAWVKNVNEAWNIAKLYTEKYPDGDITILPKLRKTSTRLKAA